MRNGLAYATWDDLTAPQPGDTRTPVERAPLEILPERQRQWREHGVVVLENAVPEALLDRYAEARGRLPRDRKWEHNYWDGWNYPTPYVRCQELLDLATAPEILLPLWGLIGDPMAVHLCLTAWVSTERNWHQDTYLNPEFLWSYYGAAWIALDDIHEDSGPFEYVAGSHLWPSLRRDRLFAHLGAELRESPDWPALTQADVARVCEAEIARRGARVSVHLPRRGDVLIWHSNLLHRGSAPRNPALLRKSLICHYSSITRRVDMPRLARNPSNGMLYFDLPAAGRVRPMT